MTRWLAPIVCYLRGHADTTDWYMPWRHNPLTGFWLDRDVVTVCDRCRATLSTRTEEGEQ